MKALKCGKTRTKGIVASLVYRSLSIRLEKTATEVRRSPVSYEGRRAT